MLGISGTELVIILFFGFLIFGPEKLPQMGRTVGRAIRQFRQASDSMNKKFQDEVKDPFEEAVAPVRDAVNEGTAPIQEDINAINENLNGIKSTITDPFKDAFKSKPANYAKPRPAASRQGAAISGGTAAAATAAASGTASAASAGKPAPSKPAAAKAPAADDAFADPFADIADDGAKNGAKGGSGAPGPGAAKEPAAGKPKGQPLPETGGSVKKSIAASLYDLDDSPAPAGTAAQKGGE